MTFLVRGAGMGDGYSSNTLIVKLSAALPALADNAYATRWFPPEGLHCPESALRNIIRFSALAHGRSSDSPERLRGAPMVSLAHSVRQRRPIQA